MRELDRIKGEPLDADNLGREAREGFRKADLTARLGRYGKAKVGALQFSAYLDQVGESALSDDLKACGNYAIFRDYFTIGEIRLSQFCTCKKHLICPLCAIRRGARALRVYLARVEHLMRENSRLRPYLVTFTVRNGDDLDERFRHLAKCLREYHRKRSRVRQFGEVLKASSAVWSYEFTNRGRGWHPHVHAIWLCEEAPDENALRNEWHAITGDSFMCDVRPLASDADGSYVSGFCEVFKYAIKFADLEHSHRLHAYRQLRGKRLQDSFGQLRGLDVEVKDSDDLLDDLPYIERLYSFRDGQYVERSAVHRKPVVDDPLDVQIRALIEQGWPDEKIRDYLEHYGHFSEAA